MGRDKRQYRFLQDTRYGRTVLAESYDVPEIVQAVTRYVARRLVERERALADDTGRAPASDLARSERRGRKGGSLRAFIWGRNFGAAALFAAALLSAPG
jgi:CRP-like cAMP-binding protein